MFEHLGLAIVGLLQLKFLVPLAVGTLVGIVGALIGSYLGYYTRRGLVNALKVNDAFIAIPEDIIAIGLAYLIVR